MSFSQQMHKDFHSCLMLDYAERPLACVPRSNIARKYMIVTPVTGSRTADFTISFKLKGTAVLEHNQFHETNSRPTEQYSSSETMAVTPVKFLISELTQAVCGGVNKPEAWGLQHYVNSGAGNPR